MVSCNNHVIPVIDCCHGRWISVTLSKVGFVVQVVEEITLPVIDTVVMADGSLLILANLRVQFRLFALGEHAAIVGVYT